VIGRIPIRLRLTLSFAVVMALALLIAGIVLRGLLARDLDGAIDQGLRARAADVAALVADAPSELAESRRSPLTERGLSYAQVVDPGGRILDATPLVRRRPLVSASVLARAMRRRVIVDRPAGGGLTVPLRVLATSARAGGRTVAVVVGAPLIERRRAVDEVGTLFLIGGPILLVLACGLGYGVARAALRPVDSMRHRAEEISGEEPDARLPVPAARDEIRRLGETLNAMLARIEAALEHERAFVADASHELRTPLAILKAELELARREGRSADEMRAAIGSAGEETDRLARLAEDLLVMARADRGRLDVAAAPVDATDLLEGVALRARAAVGAAGRPIVATAPAGLAVMADRRRLEQALGNLVDNAIAHGEGAVRLGARAVDGEVELWVDDEGGFPPEFLPRAFERFSRGDPARGRGGAGLGLAIVRAVARAHGGDAVAENLPGGGARVRLRVPASHGPLIAGAVPSAGISDHMEET
jgi:signal transduction histidine kinase